MNIEEIREYCLSLPRVTEDMPFSEDDLAFRICGKIFAFLNLDGKGMIILKCDPDYAQELREQYPCIEGAYHWNKKFWNQQPFEQIDKVLLQQLVRHAYNEVARKLPRKEAVALLP